MQPLNFRNGYSNPSHILLAGDYFSMLGSRLIRVSKRNPLRGYIKPIYMFISCRGNVCYAPLSHLRTTTCNISTWTRNTHYETVFTWFAELYNFGAGIWQHKDDLASCFANEIVPILYSEFIHRCSYKVLIHRHTVICYWLRLTKRTWWFVKRRIWIQIISWLSFLLTNIHLSVQINISYE